MSMRTKEEIARELLREADETTAPPSMELVAVVNAVASEIARLGRQIEELQNYSFTDEQLNWIKERITSQE